MSNSLCTLCFQNYGLRQEAQQLAGATIEGQCPNCLQTGGQAVDAAAAEHLMHKFFVSGSVPPEVGGPAPLYQFNSHRYPGEVTFATEVDSDLRRLSDFLKVGLFDYGPPLWRLGLTEHYQAFRGYMDDRAAIQGDQRMKLWQGILSRCSVRTIDPGADLFRVRKGETLPPALPCEFDAPPPGVATGGRYESEGLPVFYGADDIETCLHESRVTLSDWIALATFTPTRPLRILDLTDGIDDSSAGTPFERVDIFMRRLAFVGNKDYDLCQELAIEIHALGFDGFYFISYFAQAHHRNLRNIALFGHPVAAGKLRLVSVNRLRLASASYEYTFGPPNDTSLPIDCEEMHAITTKMMQGGELAKEAQKELDELLDRKSNGPR